MTREETIEQLQDQIEHQRITKIKELEKYEPEIDIFNEVLEPIGYNICDRCGNLERSDEMCWVEYMDLDDTNDKKVYDELQKEEYKHEPCVICDMCYHELVNKKGE